MYRTVLLMSLLLTLVAAGAAFAGPYWGGTYQDGRGVVCRDINNNNYYAMFIVPRSAGGLTTGQRAAIIASRLNSLYNPNSPYRTTQIVVGKQNGQYIIYIANRNGNNWLIITIDTAWARAAGTTPYSAALYWRDRMRYLATQWVRGPSGQWEKILTMQSMGDNMLPSDLKLLANPTVCDKIPKNYERRASEDKPLKGNTVPLPTQPVTDPIRKLPNP